MADSARLQAVRVMPVRVRSFSGRPQSVRLAHRGGGRRHAIRNVSLETLADYRIHPIFGGWSFGCRTVPGGAFTTPAP